jgi:hypothetical protein
LRRVNRFTRLNCLSLRNCGLLDVPPDLVDPPKTLRFLDLSWNLIAGIPAHSGWSQIKGLNLSNNAFVDWPRVVTQATVPGLTFLSLAGNPIANAPDDIGFLKHLRFADFSNTGMTIVPTWMSESPNLRIIRLSGLRQCTQFPLRYLAMFPQLKFADISGIGLYGECKELPHELVLLVALGADPATLPTGNYTLMT